MNKNNKDLEAIIEEQKKVIAKQAKTIEKNQENQNELAEHVRWDHIQYEEKIDEDFITEFLHKLFPPSICKHQKLTKGQIEKLLDILPTLELNFQYEIQVFINLARYQELDNDLIEKMKDKAHWSGILSTQDINFNFVLKYQKEINNEEGSFTSVAVDNDFGVNYILKNNKNLSPENRRSLELYTNKEKQIEEVKNQIESFNKLKASFCEMEVDYILEQTENFSPENLKSLEEYVETVNKIKTMFE